MWKNQLKRILKRKHKKWEELNVNEKLECLKVEYEYPSYIWIYLLSFFGIVAVLVFLTANNTKMVLDLYNLTGHNMTNSTIEYIEGNIQKSAEVSNAIGIGLIAILILWFYSLAKWYRRYHRFQKATKIKEA